MKRNLASFGGDFDLDAMRGGQYLTIAVIGNIVKFDGQQGAIFTFPTNALAVDAILR
jgi:uncharacterized protein YkvS